MSDAYPACSDEADHDSDNHVNKSRNNRTENDTAITVSNSHGKRIEERKGASEEYGALESGEKLINDCAGTCSEESSGCGHTVSNDSGHSDCGRHYREKLLDRENESVAVSHLLGSSVNIVNEFHDYSLQSYFIMSAKLKNIRA